MTSATLGRTYCELAVVPLTRSLFRQKLLRMSLPQHGIGSDCSVLRCVDWKQFILQIFVCFTLHTTCSTMHVTQTPKKTYSHRCRMCNCSHSTHTHGRAHADTLTQAETQAISLVVVRSPSHIHRYHRARRYHQPCYIHARLATAHRDNCTKTKCSNLRFGLASVSVLHLGDYLAGRLSYQLRRGIKIVMTDHGRDECANAFHAMGKCTLLAHGA